MKKSVKVLLPTLLALLLVFGCTACSSDETDGGAFSQFPFNPEGDQASSEVMDAQPSVEEMLIGEWHLVSGSKRKLQKVKLYEDGTCSVEGEMGTWKITNDELMILGAYGGRFWNADSIVGKFTCDGKTLEFHGAQIDGKDRNADLVYNKVG